MALEDFEKELAQQKEVETRRERHREHGKSSDHGHHRHHHHHRSSRHHDSQHDDEGHRSKRSRHSKDEDTSESRHRHRHHRHSRGEEDNEKEDKPTSSRPDLDGLKRDSWMEAPSALDVDYIQRKRPEPSPAKAANLGADFELKLHEKELNHHLRDLQSGKKVDDLETEPATHEVDYTFGDAGSQWRMTKLKAVYRQAKESGRKVEDVALERFDSLREFDDAREEEIELDRRKTYGERYVGKEKPSGELFQERKLDSGIRRPHPRNEEPSPDDVMEQMPVSTSQTGPKVDQTALNKLKAQLMRAQLRKDPKAADLEKEYHEAVASFSAQDPAVITLSAMDSRMLSSAPRNEVKAVSNRRGAERGNVEENEDMSIDDMVREERRTRGQAGGEGERFAERIAKDAKFDNDLDYMDENATKLAKRVHKSDINLRNVAINEYQKLNKILQNCPLCFHEDTDTPPIAPVVSLATRTYLTLPTEPELSSQSAMIVPTEHHTNLLECDEDEWEEIRNFMKSLTRLYHDQGRDVIFYENAAFPSRKPHAALVVVPLPYSLGETAPAFFKEAFLSTEDEWSQHKKIIDTLAKSKQGLGKLAFRRTLVKESPYFHVWFELDGGIGHIVEDADRWPRGDLFAREIIGGMLGSEPDVIKRQGKWHRGHDKRVDAFKKVWRKFDWTRILTEGNA
ncbi:Pre-mRNA-splicing factor cwf19 [Elasticomyces elasticus]|uniref:Pre-mRNA-splicing factor cwf19 n=1 Tax=Exophiala sideris TaxID=1016849 RepID=A0ABR0JDS4_9EURO|nr:Pre-mRNA-splicing factor cwf19 [Elasticomyces elasticus]KAK5031916.1 Pre-mRNA-splicing factor cwf19 [Exophiala sideris]KAK5040845.1 Pre-mRNA-splicing factor cwf19 [Exophiala sideris]KAK5061820.1 Pre-mRNA-splicing factor cwf19 [Exophiala sideris]KAK5184520.1 Pre-mRNA-splicing factor cwf19 [Eurotiomycetes sp. CCFEE 6388]